MAILITGNELQIHPSSSNVVDFENIFLRSAVLRKYMHFWTNGIIAHS